MLLHSPQAQPVAQEAPSNFSSGEGAHHCFKIFWPYRLIIFAFHLSSNSQMMYVRGRATIAEMMG